MSAPVAIRSQYSHLFGTAMLPVLEELFRSEYDRYPTRRDILFQKKTTDRDIWQYSELHDLDLFTQMSEGEEYSYKRPKQGAAKTLTIKKMGLGVSISEEAVADGKIDLVSDMIRKMGRSGAESQEVDAANIFNNGFDSTTTADGQFLFDTDHSLPSGGTYRNELSTPADLSPTALETMLYDFSTQFVGDSGIKEMIRPKYLVVNPFNERYAKELVGSSLKPDTADNNMNSFKDEGLQVVVWNHLSDTDAWFLVGDKSDTGLRIISRAGMETKSEVNFDTDSIKYKCRYREQLGAVHPKGVFGSPGA